MTSSQRVLTTNGWAAMSVARLFRVLLLTIVPPLLVICPGCGKSQPAVSDPAPFKKAIAEYLEKNNMAMALKEFKAGPTVDGNAATATASLTHATLGGPAVTWKLQFEKNADGSWKMTGYK
jgi:hypothetical protein